jgi:hypothetical protein
VSKQKETWPWSSPFYELLLYHTTFPNKLAS